MQEYELVSTDVLVIPSSQSAPDATDGDAGESEFSRGGSAPSRELAQVDDGGEGQPAAAADSGEAEPQ